MFKVGDSVVVQGLPGTVLQVVTVGQTTTYLVQLLSVQARWVNATQLSQAPAGTPAEPCIVGAIAGTIQQTVGTGPYPLYLVLLQQPQVAWVLPAQINLPLPTVQPTVNPAARPA
ncbi:MAG: hypothetical protein WBQ94_17760 [Terracidiphilus sp.]